MRKVTQALVKHSAHRISADCAFREVTCHDHLHVVGKERRLRADVRFEMLLKVWTQRDLAIHSGFEDLPCQDQVFAHEHDGHLGARRHAIGGLRAHEAAQFVEEAAHSDRQRKGLPPPRAAPQDDLAVVRARLEDLDELAPQNRVERLAGLPQVVGIINEGRHVDGGHAVPLRVALVGDLGAPRLLLIQEGLEKAPLIGGQRREAPQEGRPALGRRANRPRAPLGGADDHKAGASASPSAPTMSMVSPP